MYENTYWAENGKYQHIYDLLKINIPDSGKCSDKRFEALRLVANIYHDLYNNGGGNTTQGWARFIDLVDLKKVITDHTALRFYKKIKAYWTWYKTCPECWGSGCTEEWEYCEYCNDTDKGECIECWGGLVEWKEECYTCNGEGFVMHFFCNDADIIRAYERLVDRIILQTIFALVV